MAGDTNYPVAFYSSPSRIGVVGLGRGYPNEGDGNRSVVGAKPLSPKAQVALRQFKLNSRGPLFPAPLLKPKWYTPTKDRAIWGAGGLALGLLFGMMLFKKPGGRRPSTVKGPVPPPV